jgi:hypothetical protein
MNKNRIDSPPIPVYEGSMLSVRDGSMPKYKTASAHPKKLIEKYISFFLLTFELKIFKFYYEY